MKEPAEKYDIDRLEGRLNLLMVLVVINVVTTAIMGWIVLARA